MAEYIPEPGYSLGINGLSIVDDNNEIAYTFTPDMIRNNPVAGLALVLDSDLETIRLGTSLGTMHDWLEPWDSIGKFYDAQLNGYDLHKTELKDLLGINNISTSEFTMVDTEQSFFNPSASNPNLLVNITPGFQYSSWTKVSFAKSLVNNKTPYLNIYQIVNGDQTVGSTVYRPALYTWLSQDANGGGNIMKFFSGFMYVFGQSDINDVGGVINSHFFFEAKEDPSNSNNYAFWYRTYREGDYSKVVIRISGYL